MICVCVYLPHLFLFSDVQVVSELRNLGLFFSDRTKCDKKVTDLYESVQHAGNVLPRLYLLITVGSVYIKQADAPIDEILQDLIELCKGVQHPLRGLFLRHYLSWVASPLINVADRESIVRAFNFHISNLLESIKLWSRVGSISSSNENLTSGLTAQMKVDNARLGQLVSMELGKILQLDGVDTEMFRNQVLPQVLDCIFDGVKEAKNQQLMLDTLVNSVTPETLFSSVDILLKGASNRCMSNVSFPLDCVISRLVSHILERQFASIRAKQQLNRTANDSSSSSPHLLNDPVSPAPVPLTVEDLETIRTSLFDALEASTSSPPQPATATTTTAVAVNGNEGGAETSFSDKLISWVADKLLQLSAFSSFSAVLFATDAEHQTQVLQLVRNLLSHPSVLDSILESSNARRSEITDILVNLATISIDGPNSLPCLDLVAQDEELIAPLANAFTLRVSADPMSYMTTLELLKNVLVDGLLLDKELRFQVSMGVLKKAIETRSSFADLHVSSYLMKNYFSAVVRHSSSDATVNRDIITVACRCILLVGVDSHSLTILSGSPTSNDNAPPPAVTSPDLLLAVLEDAFAAVSTKDDRAVVLIPVLLQKALDTLPAFLLAEDLANASRATGELLVDNKEILNNSSASSHNASANSANSQIVKKVLQFVNRKSASLLALSQHQAAFNSYILAAAAVSEDCAPKRQAAGLHVPAVPGGAPLMEAMASEFLSQAVVVLEDLRTDSQIHLTCLLSLISTVSQRLSCLSDQPYKELSKLIVQHCVKLTKKKDQCAALLAAAHLFWVTADSTATASNANASTISNSLARRDGDSVVAVLNRSVEIADQATQISAMNASLYVDILDKFVLFLEAGCLSVSGTFVVQFTILCIETLQLSVTSNDTIGGDLKVLYASVRHLGAIVRHMKSCRASGQGVFANAAGMEGLNEIDLAAVLAMVSD